MNLRYDIHLAIRVLPHMQPPPGVIDDAGLKPSFRAARREMVELHSALLRVLTNYGYAVDLDSLRAKLRASPETVPAVPPLGMAIPEGQHLPAGLAGEATSVAADPANQRGSAT